MDWGWQRHGWRDEPTLARIAAPWEAEKGVPATKSASRARQEAILFTGIDQSPTQDPQFGCWQLPIGNRQCQSKSRTLPRHFLVKLCHRLFRGLAPHAGDVLLLLVVVTPEHGKTILVEGALQRLSRPEDGQAMAHDGQNCKNHSRLRHY
jgi:hypothetical protein